MSSERKGRKPNKPKVGSFVRLFASKWSWVEGQVLESFDDVIMIYGVSNDNDLDYHQWDLAPGEKITPIEKDKFRFRVDQAIRDIEQKKLKAEIQFNNRSRELEEALTQRKKIFNIDTKPLGVE